MYRYASIVLFLIGLGSCKTVQPPVSQPEAPGSETYRIAFGSCNKTSLENRFWDDILELEPDLWIWGGDNIYADTQDMQQMQEMYEAQMDLPGYRKVVEEVPVVGTWDDHDYGQNDGGVEFPAKRESQQAFLDFMGVDPDSPRRSQEGIYTSHTYVRPAGSVKVIVLDTRYFRTPLTPDPSGTKRYIPNDHGEGTVLGDAQWAWLETELAESEADFNILVSSIQVLSPEHGFETWGNFPHEVERLLRTIGISGARGVIILSGDRHISEFSRIETRELSYPLVDFTSSGLTHAYRSFKGEVNPYRVGEVVSTESFGYVVLDFASGEVTFRMMGDGTHVQQEFRQRY